MSKMYRWLRLLNVNPLVKCFGNGISESYSCFLVVFVNGQCLVLFKKKVYRLVRRYTWKVFFVISLTIF